ncbi:unknown [Ruminococcus sp. CAG:382]|nr:unknown [Ruminococcus sp. CAG:382]
MNGAESGAFFHQPEFIKHSVCQYLVLAVGKRQHLLYGRAYHILCHAACRRIYRDDVFKALAVENSLHRRVDGLSAVHSEGYSAVNTKCRAFYKRVFYPLVVEKGEVQLSGPVFSHGFHHGKPRAGARFSRRRGKSHIHGADFAVGNTVQRFQGASVLVAARHEIQQVTRGEYTQLFKQLRAGIAHSVKESYRCVGCHCSSPRVRSV